MQLTIADVLALEPVRRGAPRVITGADRLDTPVRWVHVIELAEAGHLLRGGELVLSTGIALPPDPDGLARYVAGLAAAGVSALAVELGSRYVRELPRALVTAATVHRLPLIVLERESQFIAITEAVHAQILDAQVAELRAAQRLHQVFADLAIAGAGQDTILTQASALAGTPVILTDLAHRVLACAPAFQDTRTLLAGFATRSRAAVVAGRTGYDPGAGWLVTTVGARGTDWGRLIFVMPEPPDAGATVLAERAASTLALARLVAGQPDETPERLAHRSIVAALAGTGYADPGELEARIIALGVPLAGHRLLPVIVRLSGTVASTAAASMAAAATAISGAAVAGALAQACHELRTPVICGPLDDSRVAAVLAIGPNADTGELLARLAARLRAGPAGSPATLGTAAPVSGIGQVRAALREAGDAAGALAWAGHPGEPQIATLADLGLAGLLHQLRDDPRVVSFAEREVGPLLLHDQQAGTDLTAVLGWYLESGASKAAAAQRAGLARPTLYQRLSQIEQVLGVSLASARTRLSLHAALLVLGSQKGA